VTAPAGALRRRPGGDLALIVALAGGLAILPALPPLPPDPGYHRFADARTLAGVANLVNVSSNLPFLLVGGLGIWAVGRRPGLAARTSWRVAFLGVLLVAVGSAFYHLAPGEGRLVLDRLPIVIAFMGLLSALLTLALAIDERAERALLAALLALGAAGVAQAYFGGDLRLYAWSQAAPLLAALWLGGTGGLPRGLGKALAGMVAFYALAKVAEMEDAAIFRWTSGTMGGHGLKHLLAAGAVLCPWRWIQRQA
jgi:hypothetical protein